MSLCNGMSQSHLWSLRSLNSSFRDPVSSSTNSAEAVAYSRNLRLGHCWNSKGTKSAGLRSKDLMRVSLRDSRESVVPVNTTRPFDARTVYRSTLPLSYLLAVDYR